MAKNYTKDSIESLSPRDFTRLRPGVYCGSTLYSTQLLVEIVSNSIDEFNLGNGHEIDVTIDKDVVTVQDFGQGFIPNSFRDDGKTILEAAFSVLNTSGKYRDDGVYEGTSLGSFGIGSKLCTYLSKWLTVTTTRDGLSETIHFKDGLFESRQVEETPYKRNGTTVSWQPDSQFFTHSEVEIEKVKNLFKTISCLCRGLYILLTIVDTNETINYYSNNGLNDLVSDAVKDKEIIKNRFIINNYKEGKNKMDVVLTYTSDYSSTIVPYVNTGLTETGPHITQMKTALTRELNKFFREKKWLKEKDENLSGDDCQEGLYLVFNITTSGVGYDAQVKSRITKIEMKPFLSEFSKRFEEWLNSNEKEIKQIADKALNARKAREAAKKAREAVREGTKKKTKALKFDSKLADCFSPNRKKCEIYVVEGNSAAGNLKSARDNEFTAVLPVRGKLLNVRKSSLDKIQKNAEIMTMIEAFGLKVDPKTMKLTYDEDELRYGKIIIESDADFDGSHIKNLFYTFLWTFAPQLIIDGYVYAGVPPLYKVTEGKDKYIYLKDDAALAKYKEEAKSKKYSVKHLKGLGEMSEEETEVLVNPDLRIIKQVTVADVEKANQLFDDLMGNAVEPRKEFIKNHSQEAVQYGI